MHDSLIDGEISTQLPLTDRSFLYGHGVFETIACESAKPIFWAAHYARLLKGCQRLGLEAPEESILLRELQTVCAGKAICVVRITISARGLRRGYAATRAGQLSPVQRTVVSYPWPDNVELPRLQGVELAIAEIRLGYNRQLSAIKHCNRLEQVMAASEAAVQAADEGLMLDQDGFVISAVSANIFLVCGEHIITPRMDRCGVHGVTRQQIIQAFGGRCEKLRVTTDLLSEADEVFICNSIRGIWPVVKVVDRIFEIGPVTREVQDWLGQQSVLLARPA